MHMKVHEYLLLELCSVALQWWLHHSLRAVKFSTYSYLLSTFDFKIGLFIYIKVSNVVTHSFFF